MPRLTNQQTYLPSKSFMRRRLEEVKKTMLTYNLERIPVEFHCLERTVG